MVVRREDVETTAVKELPVTSRIISSVYFSPEDGKLRLRFANGEERLFEGVPEKAVKAMVRAESPGMYYIRNIREVYRRLAA